MIVSVPQPPQENRDAASDTFCKQAASLLERDIVSGALTAGERLGIAALADRYAIGPTPIREALSRLVERGFVDAVAHKGFRVASMSRDDLEDITALRVLIETAALRRSMEIGDDVWESNIIAGFHRLRRSVERSPASMADNTPEFEELHRKFHRSLIEACDSPRMLRLHDELYLQAFRYRCVVMTRWVDRNADFVRQHEIICDAVLQRKESAADLVEEHARQICELVYGE